MDGEAEQLAASFSRAQWPRCGRQGFSHCTIHHFVGSIGSNRSCLIPVRNFPNLCIGASLYKVLEWGYTLNGGFKVAIMGGNRS